MMSKGAAVIVGADADELGGCVSSFTAAEVLCGACSHLNIHFTTDSLQLTAAALLALCVACIN
jgi:hypothetical protein